MGTDADKNKDPWELPEGIDPGNYTGDDLYRAVERFMDEFGIHIPLGFGIDERATPVILAALEEDDPTIFSNWEERVMRRVHEQGMVL